MILQALYQLADSERLGTNFEPRKVPWIVRVTADGQLLGILSTRHAVPAGASGKTREVATTFWVPRQPTGRSGTKAPACFLVDNAKYVFGRATKGTVLSPEAGREAASRFREMVLTCLRATSDKGVRAVHSFLEQVADGQQRIELPEDCRSNDLFAFQLADEPDTFVHERPAVREYWKRLRAEERGDGCGDLTCLVSGKAFGKNALFPLVEGIPGANPARIGLVSFNRPAFFSYGWEFEQNAPISRTAAEYCGVALRRLLDPAYPDPAQPGQTLPRRNLRLGPDTVVCFWSARKEGEEFCSALAGLLKANPAEVKELYRSVWRGALPPIEDPSAFYALTLSGSQGRAIVRDWFESTVSVVAGNLALHFADLEIGRITPKPRAGNLPPQFALTTLLESLSPGGEAKNVSPPLVAELIEAALHGTPYPFSVLQRSIERTRAEIGHADWLSLNRLDARAALIKAFLNRRKRCQPTSTLYPEVTCTMDPENRSEGYALGRLMAVLERLQQEALGGINASVVDRFFSGASATPKTVFVRLLKNSRHHAAKASENKRGLVLRLERIIDELADRFDPKHNGFPACLNLEQQGLFILGYHQMRRWLWMSGADRAEWEKLHPDAPPAYRWSSLKQAAGTPAETPMEEG